MNVLEMRGITKRFFGVPANDNVDLTVEEGEIHALLGENGAGKTTLMNILYGLYQPDEGEIRLKGKKVTLHSPNDAIAHGIGMVHQHFMLVDKMTVLQNIVLGMKLPGYPFIHTGQIAEEIAGLSKKHGMELDPFAKVQDLSVGMQQKVEIVKALYRKAHILILDEPTAVLTPQETTDFFRVLRTLKSDGYSIILICHKLSEILQISDTVTILRDGKNAARLVTAKTDEMELSKYMIGRQLDTAVFDRTETDPSALKPILDVDGLCLSGKGGKAALDHISFRIGEGEILGIAGVDGNGQGELAEVLAGIRKSSHGSIQYMGNSLEGESIRSRFEKGIAYIPSNRHRDGLVLAASVRDNLSLRDYYKAPYSQHGVFHFPSMTRRGNEMAQRYYVKLNHINENAGLLSGGNQQKLVLARELESQPRLVIACQPTRGLDIGASEYMRGLLMKCRNQGGGVILVSTDLEEILAMSDRIAVMHEGKIMGILDNDGTVKPETIGLLMGGHTAGEEAAC